MLAQRAVAAPSALYGPFAGFDCSAPPTAAQFAILKAQSNLAWVGGYLAPAPSHPDTAWMDHGFADARAAGFGLLPVFVGQEMADGPGSHLLTAAQGALDGQLAARLMSWLAIPPYVPAPGSTPDNPALTPGAAAIMPHSVVVLDLEQGAPFEGPRADYTVAWALAVQAAGWHPGVYCSHDIAEAVHAALTTANVDAPFMFLFRVDRVDPHVVPGSVFSVLHPGLLSGYPAADACQCEQNALITVGGVALAVDLSTCLFADPSAP